MQLLVQPNGTMRCVYGEEIDLSALGRLTISRGSHVEPDREGRWTVDLSPVRPGLTLGPFNRRSDALNAELQWLSDNWLIPT